MKVYAKLGLMAAGVIGLAMTAGASCAHSADANGSTGSLFTVSSSASAAMPDFTKAAESTINGVVSIKSYVTPRNSYYQGDMSGDPFFDFFFGNPYGNRRQQQPQRRQGDGDEEDAQQQKGLGSGVILSADGYIVTNNHVIDGAERLEVTLNDNRTFNATVIGNDPSTDLALIKIDAENLPVIPIGDSDLLKIGEWVLAVGNPFGLTSTVTAGIVSAKARSISQATNTRTMGIESYIQTDAAVNPGNSGGALVNLNGELVGINTAIYSQTGNYAGYSFAIPTSIVKKIMSDIRQYGAVQRAVLGISFRELTPKLVKEKNITKVSQGLYVMEVLDQSTAMEAGLQEGDIIVAINDAPTHTSSELQEQMARFRPGDQITVTYIRDNKQHKVEATLYNNQGSTKIVKAKSVSDLGCAFKKVDEQTMRQLRISSGLQVTGLKDGRFKDAGIKDGFIIVDINNARVRSTEDVDKIYTSIMKADGGDKVMFITGIYPTGKKMYYAVDLAD
ncbi:MAG: Do family serine endopeptidase [Muribaculaceae bacterium]|nr:Do family serine endopeptidase [Muribaculaceae bacterium]